jgi:hypothetical protein
VAEVGACYSAGTLTFFLKRSHVRRSFSGVLTLAGVIALMMMLVLPRTASAQWISYSSDPRNILEGNWQSCVQRDGRYAERVYDHVVDGVGLFEVHLGPRREFAIFKGVQDEHRDHDSPDNLLKPYRVSMDNSNRAGRHWDIPSLKLSFTVTMGGGSTMDCESWYVVLAPLEKTSH